MSEILEWIMRLQDDMSKPMEGIARKSESTARSVGKLTKEEQKLNEILKSTEKNAEELRNKLTKLKEYRELIPATAENQLKRVNSEIGQMEGKLKRIETLGKSAPTPAVGAGKSFMSKYGSVGTGALTAMPGMSMFSFLPPQLLALMGLGAGGAALMKFSADREYRNVQFTNEFGRGSERTFKQLRHQRPLYGENAVEYGKTLLRSGYSDNETISTMRQIADVANGDDAKFSGLVDLMARIREEGKLTTDTFQELREFGINPLVDMEFEGGRGFKALLNDLEKGRISADDVAESLRKATERGGEFYGNFNRLSMTAKSQTRNYLAEIGEEFKDFFGEGLAHMVNSKIQELDVAADELSSLWSSARKNPFVPFSSSGEDDRMKGARSAYNSQKIREKFGLNKMKRKEDVLSAINDFKSQKEDDLDKELEDNQAEKERINAISGGGVRNVTIRIGKMIETMTNHISNGGELGETVERDVTEAVYRALLSASGR